MTGPNQHAVVVPVTNPASVRPLLQLAAALTEPGDLLVPLSVVRVGASAEDWALARRTVEEAEQVAAESAVDADGRVVESDDVVEGVLRTVEEAHTSLVVIGWRGRSSTTNVFGRLIDTVVGRSAVPLAVVRIGTVPFRRVLLPVSPDHLLPGGDRGLDLAVRLAERLQAVTPEPATVLRTGPKELHLPPRVERLGDRIHHDPRRIDQAVGAYVRPEDVVVAAVAPTVSGLRAATTHLAWAAPAATLLVAVDVGPTRDEGLGDAVDLAPEPPRMVERTHPRDRRPLGVIVTARLPDTGGIGPTDLEQVLASVGRTDQVMVWWPADDPHPHLMATVTVEAATPNGAIAQVMSAVHEAPAFRGAEISYDFDRSR